MIFEKKAIFVKKERANFLIEISVALFSQKQGKISKSC
jgi:hypothetical protein